MIIDRAYGGKVDGTIDMFTGKEVEHTPAFGEQTLFVIGVQPVEKIQQLARKHKCTNIYFGANMSFEPTEKFDEMVHAVLTTEEFSVTLDYKAEHHKWVLECGYNENRHFISMISVQLPYIDQLNYNACIKIDDMGFDETNAGVWTHRLHQLQDVKVFTDWSKYTKDEPIGDDNGQEDSTS
jgi:hypothetical protein|tara:strand:+ start:522 stop:1064 length:543 start_codon:yes stop_codon:yes gene_type:complete